MVSLCEVAVAPLHEDLVTNDQPHGVSGLANFVGFIVARQRRVVRSIFSAGLN